MNPPADALVHLASSEATAAADPRNSDRLPIPMNRLELRFHLVTPHRSLQRGVHEPLDLARVARELDLGAEIQIERASRIAV